MRILRVKILLLVVALTGVAAPLSACCGPDAIPFPDVVHSAVLRGNHLMCANDKDHIIVVDLKGFRTFDLGETAGRRLNGDVADGRALLLGKGRLQVVELVGAKTIQEIEVANVRIHAFGFAGKGQAFVHFGTTLNIVELATGKTLHTVDLGSQEWDRAPTSAWQKVGDRLFVVGPDSTLCVIDLTTGKLSGRFQMESRAGIADLRVEGDLVYCIGSQASWGSRIDHLTCLNMKTKKISVCELTGQANRTARLADGPKGTVCLVDGKHIDRFDRSGPRTATFAPALGEGVQLLTVWQDQAVVALKGMILFLDVVETPVTAK